MKGKALPLRHEQFIFFHILVSYSCVAYIEQSDSLKLKVLRITEEFELKGSWKAMAILRIEYVKLFFVFTVQSSIFVLRPKSAHMETWNPWLSPPFTVIFFPDTGHLFLTNSDIIFCSRLFFFPAFSYFVHLYLNNNHKKDDVLFCPWSHSVAPNSSEIFFVSHNKFTLANLWPSIIVLLKKMLRYSYGQNRA